jgi:hypothetical protein
VDEESERSQHSDHDPLARCDGGQQAFDHRRHLGISLDPLADSSCVIEQIRDLATGPHRVVTREVDPANMIEHIDTSSECERYA